MKYKMILFDLDGTILNTIEDLHHACNFALTQYGLPSITVEQTKQYLGHGIRQLLLFASQNDDRIEDILKCFKTYYAKHFNVFTKTYPNIEEVLTYCQKKRLILGVYTNKVEDIARPLVLAHFTQFDFIFGEIDGRKRKPDPTFLDCLIRKYQVQKSEVLYIGDSEVDFELAKNAQIDGLCVSYGFRNRSVLLPLTDQVVDSPLEILKYLE